jgi:DNA invertase Pin-like site-specific DNA recombinase
MSDSRVNPAVRGRPPIRLHRPVGGPLAGRRHDRLGLLGEIVESSRNGTSAGTRSQAGRPRRSGAAVVPIDPSELKSRKGASYGALSQVSGLNIGYARVSTEGQDLTAQRDGLAALGVVADRIYVDHGLTGTNRARPGLREALAACRSGDTLVVTKLDRLARSLPDARDIVDELTTRQVKLNLGGSVHDPTDPVGRLLFNVLAMVAEFESDLVKMRTREGLAVARAAGRLRGHKPKLSPPQEAHVVELHRAGEKNPAELAELFGVGRSTVYRAIERAGGRSAV